MLVATGFLLCSGCAKDDDDDDDDGLSVMISGTIQPDGHDVTGSVRGYRAFAFDDGGDMIAYISSNPSATCANVVEYLSGGDPVDPVNVLSGGYCNIYLRIYDNYESGYSASDDSLSAAGSSIGCAMGEGSFEYMTLDQDDTDYYWTGQWWQGVPEVFDWTFTGDRDQGYAFDISMTEYSGSFPYEEFDRYLATGAVSGVVTAEVCEGLASTGLF